jgi:hypothetical protein
MIGLAAIILSVIAALPPGFADSGNIPKLSVTVVNHGRDETTDMFVDMIGQMSMVDKFVVADREEADRLLSRGDTDIVIELPGNVLDAMIYHEQITISVEARDPRIGAIVSGITNQTMDTLNKAQEIALAYYNAVKQKYKDKSEVSRAEDAFNIALMKEAMARGHNVKIVRTASQYEVQLLTLMLLLCAAVSAVFVAVLQTGQSSARAERRLRLYGIGAFEMWLSKAVITCGATILSGLILWPLTKIVPGFEVNVLKYVAALFILGLILHALCMLFPLASGASGRPSRTLLGCTALLLLLLFAGGGLYPPHLMADSVRLFNPVWLARLLSGWTLSGTPVPAASLVSTIIPAGGLTALFIAYSQSSGSSGNVSIVSFFRRRAS